MSLFQSLLTTLADKVNPDKQEETQSADEKALAAQRALLRSVIEKGCREFHRELYGEKLVYSFLDSPHHREAIEWHFEARLGFLKIAEYQNALDASIKAEEITREQFTELLDAYTRTHKPQYLAYFPIWARGNAKSMVAEHLAVTDALLSFAYTQPGFCLYIGSEKTKIIENISNIESILSSPQVQRYCPQLSQVEVNEETNQKRQWTGRFLHTKAGYVFKGGSVTSAQAGSRVDKTRVTLMIFDDIDGRNQSAVETANRATRMAELIPMRQWNTLVFWAQNLIDRQTVMYAVHKQRLQLLTNRKPTQPVPAVMNLEYEMRADEADGIIKPFYKSGTPTWHVWTVDRINDEMQSQGIDIFKKECQHEVDTIKEGRVFPNYEDGIHVITESEFEAVHGVRRPPAEWFKYFAHDWARTKTEFHANVAFWSAVSPARAVNPGFFFIYEPMSFEADTQPDTCALRFIRTLQERVTVGGAEMDWEDLLRQNLTRQNLEQHITDTTELINKRRAVTATVIKPYVQAMLAAQNVKRARMSHERDDILKVYNQTYGFNFHPANPTKKAGVQELNDLMAIDYRLPHPFKPGVLGYTRFFIIVPDERAARREDINPATLHDHDLIRHQFIEFRYQPPKLTESGETSAEEFEKTNDDFPQAATFLFMDNAPFNEPLSDEEQVAETIRIETPHLAPEVIQQMPEEERGGAIQAQLQKFKEVQRSVLSGKGNFKNPMKRFRR